MITIKRANAPAQSGAPEPGPIEREPSPSLRAFPWK